MTLTRLPSRLQNLKPSPARRLCFPWLKQLCLPGRPSQLRPPYRRLQWGQGLRQTQTWRETCSVCVCNAACLSAGVDPTVC